MGEQSFVLFSQLQGQFETALLENVGAGVTDRQHILGFSQDGLNILNRRVFRDGVNEKRGKLVCLASWYVDVPYIPHVRPLPPSHLTSKAGAFVSLL
jgi:hypothetical protein